MSDLHALAVGRSKVVAGPLTESGWDQLVARSPCATIFHTREWARVLWDSYGYKRYCFSTVEAGELNQAICLFEVNSWLTGKRAVCVPFSDECPVLGAKSSSRFARFLGELVEFGLARGWKSIEVRGVPPDFLENHSDSFYTHDLDIHPESTKIFGSFDASVRRAVRKAEKIGVQAEIRSDPGAIEEYFELHCLTRRKHGVPPQPLDFFHNIHRHLIARGMGFTVLARLNEQALAGAVFLHFQGKGLYKFGASNPRADRFRPGNLVMWRGIQQLSEIGVKCLSFGRTSIAQEGLRRYKLGWGTRERQIFYVKLNIASRTFVAHKQTAQATWLFSKLPVPLLKRVGAFLYPHLG
jgi:hypothetical protein